MSTMRLFWQDKKKQKNSVAPRALSESKLPSSNTLGEADVLQGPHRGHRRGRKRRCIRPFLTRLKTWLQNVVSEYSYSSL